MEEIVSFSHIFVTWLFEALKDLPAALGIRKVQSECNEYYSGNMGRDLADKHRHQYKHTHNIRICTPSTQTLLTKFNAMLQHFFLAAEMFGKLLRRQTALVELAKVSLSFHKN